MQDNYSIPTSVIQATAKPNTINLNVDLLDLLTSYLWFDDSIKLFVLTKGTQHRWIQLVKRFERIVKEAIMRDFQVPIEFFEYLQASQSMISGGYILKILLGIPCEPDVDMDIYSRGSIIFSFCKLSDYLWKVKCSMQEESYSYENYPALAHRGIERVRTYAKRFQHILLRIPTKEFIINTFDFEFCTTMFDGAHLHIPFPMSIMNRKSVHREHKICGEGIVNREKGLDVIGRCIKYTNLGFTIPNYVDSKTIRIPVYESRYSKVHRPLFRWDRNITGLRYVEFLKDYNIVYCHKSHHDNVVATYY